MPTYNNLIVKQLPFVDARGHSSPPNPVQFNAQTIFNAIAAIKADPNISRTLLIASGTWDIDQNIPLNPGDLENIHLRFEAGAVLQVRPGITVTIEGSLDAPLTQIFVFPGAGTGIVQQSSSSNIQFVYPQWWGAKGDGGSPTPTDCTDAFNRAIRFFGEFTENPPNPPTVTGKPGTLVLTSGEWTLTSDVRVTQLVLMRFEGGAVLRLEGTANVSMNGLFEAPLDQIFNLQGSGRVKLGTREIRDIFPQWWGARGDYNPANPSAATDDTFAIQRALDAAADGIDSLNRRCVVLPENTYWVSSTLTIRSDLRGQSSPVGKCATILYTGHVACLQNISPYTNGMNIRNLKIDMKGNGNDNVIGIHCQDGHVQGFFENVLVQCNPDWHQDGIYIQGLKQAFNPDTQQFDWVGSNCTSNQFINVGVEFAEIGIWIGDSNPAAGHDANDAAQGGSNFISGGVILAAKTAAILLTGGQNAIIGGDHSGFFDPVKVNNPTVILFAGGVNPVKTARWCRNNSIAATTLDIQNGNASHYAIRIDAMDHLTQIFNAPSIKTAETSSFVTDNDPRQRWVAVRTDAKVEAYRFEAKDTVEARAVKAGQWVDATQLFTKNVNELASGNIGSLIGVGPGRALYVRGSADLTPGTILLGAADAPSSFDEHLPVLNNGVTFLIGSGGRIYFAKLTSATIGAEIANMDAEGHLTLQGGFQMSTAGGNGRFWKYASAMPVEPGTVGDIVWNNNPVAGGNIGWVYTSDGWRAFGIIS